MKNWEKIEINCFNFLKNNFEKLADFELKGGANSTIPDIEVFSKDFEKNFFIEVKSNNSQAGQFVLNINHDKNCFEYSNLNKTSINEETLEIIRFMNKNFENFKVQSTKGKEISLDGLEKWIKNYYKSKNVKYIITEDCSILDLENLDKYFKVSASYRIKKSGSSNTGKLNTNLLQPYLKQTDQYSINKIEVDNSKLYVYSNKDLNNIKFDYNDNEFMFSKRDNKYEIRKLSKTCNSNVIFSLTKKDNIDNNIFINKEKFSLMLKKHFEKENYQDKVNTKKTENKELKKNKKEKRTRIRTTDLSR